MIDISIFGLIDIHIFELIDISIFGLIDIHIFELIDISIFGIVDIRLFELIDISISAFPYISDLLLLASHYTIKSLSCQDS